MPIGLVNDDEFNQELGLLSPVINKGPVIQGQVIDKPNRGRADGDINVPDSLRQIIGETSVIEGRKTALGLAGMFGISPSSVSAYAKGATSTTTYHEPSKSIISHINKSRRRAIKKAQVTLDSALGSITQEKLDYTDAKDLASIAKDMSVIIKNLEPPPDVTGRDQTSSTPQFVIYAPQFKDERSFESITINE